MACAIEWNTLSIEEWETFFRSIPRSNILQSYDYARAFCPIAKQKARWGLIEIDGKKAGIVQIFEAGLFGNLLHAVMLDRGPLWFPGFGNAMHVKRFFDEFNRQFPKRFARKRRIIPELADGPSARKLIEQYGYERLDGTGYQTFWLDLTKDEEALRAAMKPNWRNKLSKAERAVLTIEKVENEAGLDNVSGIYAADKSLRGYGGPSPALLRSYGRILLPKNQIIVLKALKDGEMIAFTLFVLHGQSATYFAGWSSPSGRDNAAHHLLLWDGIKRLKSSGIADLDLGGINEDNASGVTTFKEGLGGDRFTGVGHYR